MVTQFKDLKAEMLKRDDVRIAYLALADEFIRPKGMATNKTDVLNDKKISKTKPSETCFVDKSKKPMP